MENKKLLKEARTIFNNLKTDPNSALFSEERIDQWLLRKLKKSRYSVDSQLVELIPLADNRDFLEVDKTPTRADYVEKRETESSTWNRFDEPFQLLHADVGNLEFLGKNAEIPQYALMVVDLYSSKVYVYPMRSRKQILQKMKLFYDEVRSKRKNKRMRLQVDTEFQQVKIKDLKDEKNVEMFTSSVRGGKAFAAEQKIRELKTRIAKSNAQKLKITPTKIIQNLALNKNTMKSEKYGLSPEEIEQQSLASEQFKTIFNMHRIDKTRRLHERLDWYDRKQNISKRRRLRRDLMISEKVLILAERIKTKDAPDRFYKQFVQNISYFNKERTFMIRKKQSIDGITFYWLTDVQNSRKVPKRFQRTKLFAIRGNFVM